MALGRLFMLGWPSRAIRWRRQCAVNAPTFKQSCADCFSRQPHDRGPFSGRLSFATKSHATHAASVHVLFGNRRPSAICRAVLALGIGKPINGVFRSRLWPHVAKKRFKRMKPSFTYGSTNAAIAFIACCVRVVASVFHARPCNIFGRLTFAVRRACIAAFFSCGVTLQASAAFSCAVLQHRSNDDLFDTALATASPNNRTVAIGADIFKNGKATELTANKIFRDSFRHKEISVS